MAHSRAATIERPDRREIYLSIRPDRPGSLADQLSSIHEELAALLGREGPPAPVVVWERLFLASPLPPGGLARARAGAGPPPGGWAVVQPPCAPGRLCELQACAVAGTAGAPEGVRLTGSASRGPGDLRSLVVESARSREVHLAGARGAAGGRFFDEAMGMFEAAEAELRSLGSSFHDVARTWIHLSDMGRDYEELNRARRAFLGRRGIVPFPASTGIGGAPLPLESARGKVISRCALSLHAAPVPGKNAMTPLHAPTLNEAWEYGSDFSRGMRVPSGIGEGGGALLHISGTSAVDEAGRSAAPGDFEGQVDRTLLNVRSLLEGQGAGLGDVVAMVTYLKDRRLLPSYEVRAEKLGLLELPHAIVEADICRPELLCEVEAIAAI